MAAITEDTLGGKKASFVFFYYIKIQKFERKFSYGTKRWKWYGDMNMTLLSYSHRSRSGSQTRALFLFPVCFLLNFSLRMAADGDCVPVWDALKRRVFRPGFSLLVEEMRDPRSKKWSRMVTDHRTAVANERKVIQILYIRLWYSTIQYELIAHNEKKLSEA